MREISSLKKPPRSGADGFGQGRPVGRRSKFRKLLVWGFFAVAVFFVVPKLFGATAGLYSQFAEQEPPVIEVPKPPAGIGLNPVRFSITVSDKDSGIDQIVVRAEQSGKTFELMRKDYSGRTKLEEVPLVIDGKALKFNEGKVKFTVTAFDKSFWSNPAKHSFVLSVDYGVPKLEVLTTQHNAVRTGVELVFYRVINDTEAFSGVTVGGNLFPGFLARQLDPAFGDLKDLRFAFFAVPRGFDASRGAIRVLARDAVGNDGSASIYYRVQERSASVLRENLSMEVVHEFVESMYPNYLRDEAKITGAAPREYFPAVNNQERIQRFRELNVQYRDLIERAIEPLFAHPKSERFWEGRFLLPPGPRLSYRVGDTQQFVVETTELGSASVRGLEFDTPVGREIRAANGGTVIYADTLGLYGMTVIVDHGFGLTSVYANLSEKRCIEGDSVKGGTVIGLSGMSAITGKPRFEFQTRVHGVPVRPEEWFDETWLRAHVEEKISLVKKQFGIRQTIPLQEKPL